MPCPDRLSQWSQQVSTAFAHLSKPQVWGLVLWSAGIALSGAAGITQISALLSLVLEQEEQTVFQRLREWYLDAKHKSGKKRRELDVASCFAPLLCWMVRLWEKGNQQMVLVLDATTLGERWTILSISVVVRSCAIPVAWKVLGGHEKGSWRPHWEGLLKSLEGSIPADWQVLVLADRGLYARWLFQAICACGWHPFLRINLGVKARAVGEESFDWIGRWTPVPGTSWKGTVECFAGKASRLTCTLLMHWEAGYEHPWAVLTDLKPEEAEVSWYGMRTWIETGFKDAQTWSLGLAPQQDAGGESRGAALAGDGRGPGLDSERGLPGGREVAPGVLRRATASTAYRFSPTQTASGPAADAPVELCGARTSGVGGSSVQSRGLAVRQTAGRSLA